MGLLCDDASRLKLVGVRSFVAKLLYKLAFWLFGNLSF